jgi:hypothetical protein
MDKAATQLMAMRSWRFSKWFATLKPGRRSMIAGKY